MLLKKFDVRLRLLHRLQPTELTRGRRNHAFLNGQATRFEPYEALVGSISASGALADHGPWLCE